MLPSSIKKIYEEIQRKIKERQTKIEVERQKQIYIDR